MENKSHLEEFVRMNQEARTRLRKLERTYGLISFLRGIVFLAALVLLLVGFTEHWYIMAGAGAVCVGVFVYLVQKHIRIVKQTELEKSRERASDRYVKRHKDEWRSFEDDGSDFLKPEDSVAMDIDLLGPDSLYQLIHVCHTERGRDRFAACLREQSFTEDEIAERKEALSELMEDIDFAVDFEANLLRVSDKKKKLNVGNFEKYCRDKTESKLPVWAHLLRFLLPLAVLTTAVLSMMALIPVYVPFICFFITLSVSWLAKSVTDAIIIPVYGISAGVSDYLDLFDLIAAKDFRAGKLKALRERIAGDHGILASFRALDRISQAYNISFNPLVHLLLSGLLLWDFQLASFVGRWHDLYGENAAESFECIAHFEELMSFATLGLVREVCFAEVRDEQRVYINTVGAKHPLIAPAKVKGNDCELKGGIIIVTGSNMSGKTTFLRTLAVNLVLANLGAPVCAERFSASRMKLFTSMRVRDDVANGISTFYAEILRIKAMAEYKKKNLPMVCLIDEIFKGTNSADRIVGATHVIRELSGENCMTVVSTHDFELCDMQGSRGEQAVNLHFEEYYEGDELKFDYELKNGRCTTTNARAILRMAGFDVK